MKLVVVRFSGSAFFLFLFALLACESHEGAPVRTGEEFVPIQVGAWWEYSMTETTISPVTGQVNTISDLRVEVLDSIPGSDETTFVLGRWTRDQGAASWTAAETWSVRQGKFRWVVQEGNTPFVKLAFPLIEGKTWDGNMLNSLGGPDTCNGTDACDSYKVTGLQKPFEITGTVSYTDTVTIEESNEDDPIVGKNIQRTIYAKGVGLVYIEKTIFEYCTVGPCIGQQVVENGYILKQILTAHGVE